MSADQRGKNPAAQKRRSHKIRYAVVGLGHIAQAAVLPAFAHASKNSELAALVSGDPVKLKQLGKKYGIKNLYTYAEFDDCLSSGDIDAVYIALPNSMHREYAIRSAMAGVHVLCEKPMAIKEEDCQAMIAAAEENNIKLMIAYRLHFEEANLTAIEIVNSGKIGDPRIFNSVFTMQVPEGDIRVKQKMGGGALYDIGIYCVNAARYLFKDEPTEVVAFSASKNDDERFYEVDEITSCIMRFPDDRLASFTCSFGATDIASLRVVGSHGEVRLSPAYEYEGEMTLEITVGEKTRKRVFPKRDQFGPELFYFSESIINNSQPEPSGLDGLIDVRIIRAIYQSARSGKVVTVDGPGKTGRPTAEQQITRTKVRRQELVHTRPPAKSP